MYIIYFLLSHLCTILIHKLNNTNEFVLDNILLFLTLYVICTIYKFDKNCDIKLILCSQIKLWIFIKLRIYCTYVMSIFETKRGLDINGYLSLMWIEVLPFLLQAMIIVIKECMFLQKKKK